MDSGRAFQLLSLEWRDVNNGWPPSLRAVCKHEGNKVGIRPKAGLDIAVGRGNSVCVRMRARVYVCD